MGWPHRAVGVLLTLGLAVGCSTGGSAPPQTGSPEEDAGMTPDRGVPRDAFVSEPPDDPPCERRSCGPDECDVVDDGCGGTMDCGPCGCQPRTCDDLGYHCGTGDDGCGGSLDCNDPGCGEGSTCEDHRCVCAPDDDEANDSPEEPTDLGAIEEGSPDTYVEREGRNVQSTDDEDWFVVHVTDTPGWEVWYTNPEIHVDVSSDAELEVTAFYACDADGDLAVDCGNAQPYDVEQGIGCKGSSRRDVVLTPDCDGRDESGRLTIRVAHSGDGSCEGYDLRVTAL